jgi:hypothetical protein
MAAELSRILRTLEAGGVTALAFKGPTLALLAYGNLALRDSADLDFLVPHHQLASAIEIPSADGYYKKSPRFHVDYFQLPERISAAYYLIRPFRVAGDALRNIHR